MESSPAILRFRLILSAMEDEALVRAIETERKGRRNHKPVRTVWNSPMAGIVLGIRPSPFCARNRCATANCAKPGPTTPRPVRKPDFSIDTDRRAHTTDGRQFRYDPTNGTVSQGCIRRAQASLISTSFVPKNLLGRPPSRFLRRTSGLRLRGAGLSGTNEPSLEKAKPLCSCGLEFRLFPPLAGA